eukprot:TRINITY_DN17482_c0_g3_i1.p2 TRINITY_DN17482_c0_g3~~TRINITY_DN17482_c0_g3_i1.p2  ORF type:complete len:116 (+),score=0.37 TRINITY_DN17482_c0_g3_i1:516-863(+)
MLRRLGHKVVLAEDGYQAVQMWEENIKSPKPQRFDCCIMDISMPVMDGIQATKEIRLREQQLGVEPFTIIALTAHAIPGLDQECFQAGMNDYAVKPIQKDELARRLSRVPLRHVP